MGFKLLEVPYLVQRLALGQMELMELLDLTFMSPILASAASSLHIETPSFYSRVGEKQMSIQATILNQNSNQNLKIVFSIDKVPSKTMHRKWARRRIQIKRSGKTFTLKCGKDYAENISIFEDLSKHLLSGMLKVQEFHLHSLMNIFDTTLFRNNQKYDKVQLVRHDITVEQARFLLEQMDIDDLILSYTGPKCAPEDFELKHRIMELGNVDWLSFKSILNMKCEILRVDRVNHMTQKSFSEFIRTWANGGFENLQEFQCKVPYLWEFSDTNRTYVYREDVYKSFEEMEITVVKATRDGHQKTLQRKCDGKKAELIFKEYFKFVVVQEATVT